LEQIRLELRQVPRTDERRRVDKKWRLDLAVAVIARVEIEHEVDQRALEPCAGAAQHRETRAGHARRPLEVDDAKRRAQIPVRLRLEIKRPRLAMLSDLGVVPRGLADRDRGVRKVRQHQQRLLQLMLDRIELYFELF